MHVQVQYEGYALILELVKQEALEEQIISSLVRYLRLDEVGESEVGMF